MPNKWFCFWQQKTLLRFPLLFMIVLIGLSFASRAQQTPPGKKDSAALFAAIRSGSTVELKRQLANGSHANDMYGGYSALMTAALDGTAEQMKILIEQGAVVNYADQDSVTALWFAIPDMEKTKLLLDHGADPSLHSKEGYNVLVKLAFMPGTYDVFKMLVDKGADPKKSAPDNLLLYNAAASGDTAILGLLIRSGLPVNDTVAFGDYPINAPMAYRTFGTLKMLVDNGANVNAVPKSVFGLIPLAGSTALMFAGLYNAPQSFFYLLEHGADPNKKNNRGYTALMMLQQSENDDPAMTAALIEHGADAGFTAPDGTNALYYALQKGNTKSAELLKKHLNK
jgi:ankyrin repeat protein